MHVFVSAIYKIYDRPYAEEIWQRLYALTEFFELHLFISEADAPRIANHSNIIPYYREFNTFETYKIIMEAKNLPPQRSPPKDTKEYMVLMNAKTEMIQHVKSVLNDEDIKHYIWLDAGLSKIFSDPVAAFDRFRVQLRKPLASDAILIPGCWSADNNLDTLAQKISWRFCGGFFIVPTDMVDQFAYAVLEGNIQVRDLKNMAIWEVNVWAFIEPHLPIQWVKGDHNDSMLKAIDMYFS